MGDIRKLKDAGYRVVQKSPWHFQVLGKVLVNIWPTKNKYMVQYAGGASHYGNIVEKMHLILGNPKDNTGPQRRIFDVIREQHERSITSAMREAEVIWRTGLKAFQDSIPYVQA